jgi:glycerol kinase
MRNLILAIDQGTTGTTVLAIDNSGRVVSRAYREIRQFFPKPGWVEHDPIEIFDSTVELSRKALRAARAKAADVRAIGITNQRETFVLWERKTGRPLNRAIVWQCRRSAELCESLRGHDYEREVTRRTGLLLDPYFSGTKLKWLLDRNPKWRVRSARGELCFGTIDSWLLYKMSGGTIHATDYTNASRTMLLNLDSLDLDPEMLHILDVPRELLPSAIGSRGPIAETIPALLGGRSVPIGAIIGDQQSALFGQGAVHSGEAKSTYGTGAFLLMNTGRNRPESNHRLLATSALGPNGEPVFALEGSVFVAGAAIQWVRDQMGFIKRSAHSLGLARSASDSSGVYMVPAFVGLGAPYWDAEARGAIVGITRGTTRADIVRAALDSIAFQVHDVFVAMEADFGSPTTELRADGGASANDYLMQFQADILDRTVSRPAMAETTALGAAILAGLATGLWKSHSEVSALNRGGKRFKPRMKAALREQLLAGWRAAVGRVLSHTDPRRA